MPLPQGLHALAPRVSENVPAGHGAHFVEERAYDPCWQITVGFVVGCRVGGSVGAAVGARVGAIVGCWVGDNVGNVVGLVVGFSVTSVLQSMPCHPGQHFSAQSFTAPDAGSQLITMSANGLQLYQSVACGEIGVAEG